MIYEIFLNGVILIPNNSSKKINGLHRNILKMYIFKFLLGFRLIGGVIVLFFTEWGNITFSQVMFLQSYYFFFTFTLEVPTGVIADKIGRKTSLLLGAFAMILGVLAFTVSPNFYWFLAGEFLWAMGLALFSGADDALTFDSLKETNSDKQSKQVFGRMSSFHILALMISAPIGSLVAKNFGLRITMLSMIIPFLFAFIVALQLREPDVKGTVSDIKYRQMISLGLKYIATHKPLQILALNKMVIGTLAFLIIWTYQPLLTQQEVPIEYFGVVFAAITLAQIVFLNFFEKLEKLFRSKRNYIFFSGFIPGIAFMFMGFSNSTPVLILLILTISAFGLTRFTLLQNYINKHIESHIRSTVLSTLSMVDRIFSSMIYPLAGLLVDRSLQNSFIVFGSCIILFTLFSNVRESYLLD